MFVGWLAGEIWLKSAGLHFKVVAKTRLCQQPPLLVAQYFGSD